MPQTSRDVPRPMHSAGWRKLTPGIGAANRLAREGEQVAVPKARAFVAVKRVGAHLGLKASDMMLLDTLGAFTQPQDWEEGRRPIVWASNAYLIERTGFSLSALKRHTRRLAELGVIAFQDSPNGKRWGRRDANGVIIEAYGFNLAPLAARAEEFEQLHSKLLAERELCKRLKRQITIFRRMIRAQIETARTQALAGPWRQLASLFEDLLAKLPRGKATSEALNHLLMRFRNLQERVELTFLKKTDETEAVENLGGDQEQVLKNTREMDPKVVISEPHIQTTNQLNPVISNAPKIEKTADVEPKELQVKKVGGEPNKKADETRNKHRKALELSTLMQACPEFASWARNMGGYVNDWIDLHRVAGQLGPMIGITEQAWHTAQDRLGKQAATAALMLVFDKHCTGEVASPGGYLLGMVKKAVAGELRLERSFYGRLSGQAA